MNEREQMFTGLIEGIGRLRRVGAHGRGLRVVVEHALAGDPIRPGESIAVDGCCLTAVAPEAAAFSADVSAETLSRTGGRSRWRAGRKVNLERSLRVGDRLGGHVVLGHVDALARLQAVRRSAGDVRLRFALPAGGERVIAEKGSVALDGVSLTVARVGRGWFEVAVIPETLARTTLGSRRPGDLLAVEYDVLARYAQRAAGPARG